MWDFFECVIQQLQTNDRLFNALAQPIYTTKPETFDGV